MSSMGDVGTVSSFQGKEYEAFYWKIGEFSKLSEKENCHYESPGFNFKDKSCCLKLYPNGTSSTSEGFFGLFFRTYNVRNQYAFRIHLLLGLKTQSGRIEKWFGGFVLFSGDSSFGSSAMIRRSEFLKRKEELAPSDCLTFVVFLSPEAVEIIRDVADQSETSLPEENGDSEKKGSERVLDDIAKLWGSGDRSDATVIVGGAEYKVHSCILAARTPVFAALFQHDTLEKATRKVTITDCEPAIFEEFLNHLYTGSVQNLTSENAFGLYRVSDKYLVRDLKDACRQCIVDSLSPETFCEAVQLAQGCGDRSLRESALDYFSAKYRIIIRSAEWQLYIKENPIEANEILIRLFGPL